MYVSIRTYRVGKGSIDELMHRVDRDLADAFAQETGFIAYKVITFTQDVSTKITNLELKTSQSLDLKKQVCSNTSLTGLLGSSNDFCK